MTKESFSLLMSVLRAKKASIPWDDDVQQCFALGVGDIPESVVPALAKRVARECDWRPEVPEVLRMASELLTPRELSDVPTAADALVEVLGKGYSKCQKRVPGTNVYTLGRPPFSHPYIVRTIEALGGWEAWCDAAADEKTPPNIRRKNFLDLYEAIKKSGESQRTEQLQGEWEQGRALVANGAPLMLTDGGRA